MGPIDPYLNIFMYTDLSETAPKSYTWNTNEFLQSCRPKWLLVQEYVEGTIVSVFIHFFISWLNTVNR